MCKAVEEYATAKAIESEIRGEARGEARGKIKGKIETIRNMLKENIPLEVALKCAELDKATYDKYSADILGEQ